MADQLQGIRQPLIKFTQLFVYNNWQNAYNLKTTPVINPATGKTIAKVQQSEGVDVDRAVAAARCALNTGSPWRLTDASGRGRLLCALADLLERDRMYIASLETFNCGKPIKDTYHRDLTKAVFYLRHFAGWTDKIMGTTIPIDGEYLCYTRYEPRGVVAAILPWTYPLLLFCVKLGCALAAGNTLVVKPAEQTPLSALYVASLCKQAGFPPGVVNVVPGLGPGAGHALAAHVDVDMLSFTGSTEVGHYIQIASGGSNLKHLHMELSGKSPNIVFPDADRMCSLLLGTEDVEAEFGKTWLLFGRPRPIIINYVVADAVEKAHTAVFENMGQSCTAGSRTFVHADIYDEFVAQCVHRTRRLTVGDPFDPATDSGSQIDAKQTRRILDLVASGKAQGARLECGGGRCSSNGFFVEPTVFSAVTDDMHIAQVEICGPVMTLLRFQTLEEVVARANRTQYGLAGGVFTSDINKALSIAEQLHAGTVWVNAYNEKRPNVPFGGYKMSGVGKEQGFGWFPSKRIRCSNEGILGIEEYCQVKTVMIKLPQIKKSPENVEFSLTNSNHRLTTH